MKFTYLPRFTRDSIAWSDLLLAAPFAGNLDTEQSVVHIKGVWHPLHAETSAYANHPMVSPLVDGRLFVRGRDSIYCYDLRQTAAK